MSRSTYDYLVLDVFTERPFAGNPLAVFPDAGGLTDAQMQTLARELNLSETAFVFAPELAGTLARLRIFTPGMEVPFAGHPTVGTALALCRLGRVPARAEAFALQEQVGRVDVRVEWPGPSVAWLRTPPIAFGETYDPDACSAALGLTRDDVLSGAPVQMLSAGNPFLYVPLRTPEAVDRAALDARSLEAVAPGFAASGVFVFAPRPEGAYSRMFAPLAGILEDPATGSATGPLAAYLVRYGLCERRQGLRLLNEQGVKMRRPSQIYALLHFSGATLDCVEIGGSAVNVIQGSVTL